MYYFRLLYFRKDLSPLKVLLRVFLGVLEALYNFKNIAYTDGSILQLLLIKLSLRDILNN